MSNPLLSMTIDGSTDPIDKIRTEVEALREEGMNNDDHWPWTILGWCEMLLEHIEYLERDVEEWEEIGAWEGL